MVDLILNGDFESNKTNWQETGPVSIEAGFSGNGARIGDAVNYGGLQQQISLKSNDSSIEVTFKIKVEETTNLAVVVKELSSTYGVRVFIATTGSPFIRETDPTVTYEARDLGGNWSEIRFRVSSPIPVGSSLAINGRGLIDDVSATEIGKPVDIIESVKPYLFVLIGLGVAGVAGYFIYKRVKNRRPSFERETTVL